MEGNWQSKDDDGLEWWKSEWRCNAQLGETSPSASILHLFIPPSCLILEYSIHLLPLIPLQQFLPQFPLISPILFHFLLFPTFLTKSTLSISLHLSFSNHIFFHFIMTSTGTDFGMQGLISIVNDIQEVFSIIGILSFYA